METTEKTYKMIYCTQGDIDVLVKKNLTLRELTSTGWWADQVIDPCYRDLDDPTWEKTIEKPLDKLTTIISKELKRKSSVVISGNYGYLTICEANKIINLNII